MKSDDEMEMVSTTADFVREMLADEQEGEEFATAYFKTGFLTSAVDALVEARRGTGLTQADVAAILHTKQPAIARLESDTSGSMSLRRYAEAALACNSVPLIMLAPKQDVVQYVFARPDAPLTAEAYLTWHFQHQSPVTLNVATSSGEPMGGQWPWGGPLFSTLATGQDASFAMMHLNDPYTAVAMQGASYGVGRASLELRTATTVQSGSYREREVALASAR